MGMPIGRPPTFDREQALRGAALTFWEVGYHATSMPQLLAGMGIARSSFYAAFGSKHDVLIEALRLYNEELYVQMERAAAAPDADAALWALLDVAACSVKPDHGCLFVNTVSELGPRDDAVQNLAQAHLNRVRSLFEAVLQRLPRRRFDVSSEAGALLALAIGAIVLRKAGRPEREIRSLLDAKLAVLTA